MSLNVGDRVEFISLQLTLTPEEAAEFTYPIKIGQIGTVVAVLNSDTGWPVNVDFDGDPEFAHRTMYEGMVTPV